MTPRSSTSVAERTLPPYVPEYREDLLYRFQTQENIVILTIDDGYSDSVMNQFLDLLEQTNTNATFFLVGTTFEENLQSLTLERLVKNGNDIGYHSYSHPEIAIVQEMTIADWQMDYDLWKKASLEKMGGEAFAEGLSPYARAPWGVWTPAFKAFCSESQLIPVQWNANEYAFTPGRTPIQKGSILILHVDYDDLEILQKLLDSDWEVLSLRQALTASQ
jgi:peptidoglycan/xylan/chitin deacetylase (PgdA/CDA1 family)